MLLGCCHCGEDPPSESTPPPSESTPPSESVSESVSESGSSDSTPNFVNRCADGLCIGGVFASRYRLNFSFGSSNVCGVHYQGDFTLYFRGSAEINTNLGIPNICEWSTNELAIERSGLVCRDYNFGTGVPAPKRFVFEIKKVSAGGFRFTLTVWGRLAPPGMTVSGISYFSNFSGLLPINCLSSITLPIQSDPGAPDPYSHAKLFTGSISAVSGVNHCPLTVTLVPV